MNRCLLLCHYLITGQFIKAPWATDILFKSTEALANIYPSLIQHGIRTFGSPDVMRFLGKNLPAHKNVHRKFSKEIVTDLKDRPEGVRIKHRIDRNSIKLYDKQGARVTHGVYPQ